MTRAEAEAILRRRHRILWPAAAIACIASLAYVVAVATLFEPLTKQLQQQISDDIRSAIILVLFGLTFVVFLVPLEIAHRAVRRHKLACPGCQRAIRTYNDTQQLLTTGHCPNCDEQFITDITPRKAAAFARRNRARRRKLSMRWFVALTVLAIVFITVALSTKSPGLMAPAASLAFLGAPLSAYLLMRTRQKALMLPTLALVVLAALTAFALVYS